MTTQETYTGADASGSDSETNRVITLENERLTLQTEFSVYLDGLYLQLDSEYSVSHNSESTEITILIPVWDSQKIVVNYETKQPTRFISVENVRDVLMGLNTSEISDSDVGEIICDVEYETEKILNTKFTPTEEIDFLDGNGSGRLMIPKTPLLSLKELKIDGTDITIEDNVQISKSSGKIELDNVGGSPEETSFKDKQKAIAVKYLYGWLEESDTETTLSTASSAAGTSVTLSVSDASNFSVNDWIEIYGMDGNREVTQITGTDTGEITVDELILTHAVNSKIIKLQTREIFKKLMKIVAGIILAIRMMGQTYTVATGYSIGEFSIQKGVPYTHFAQVTNSLIKQRDNLLQRIQARPAILGSS